MLTEALLRRQLRVNDTGAWPSGAPIRSQGLGNGLGRRQTTLGTGTPDRDSS